MGNLTPLIDFLLFLRRNLEKGHSSKWSIDSFLQSAEPSDFKNELLRVQICFIQEQSLQPLLRDSKFRLRRQLWVLLEKSRAGEPILPFLLALEEDAIAAFEEKAEQQTRKLPFLMLLPLLFFQFPAFGLLILGPLLDIFLHSMK